MRLKYVILNSLVGILLFLITGLLGFVRRKVMIITLGGEIIGLIALYSDVLSLLNMVDIGLSGAVGAVLYEPIYKANYSKIKGILNFYKKLYKYAGILFVIFSLVAIVPVGSLVNSSSIPDSQARLYFIMYALNTAITYFFSYKLILMATDQKLVKLRTISGLIKIVTIILNITVLLFLKSFLAMLVVEIISNCVYLFIMSKSINSKYYLLKNETALLEKKDKTKIVKSIKGLVFHRIASFFLYGTNYIFTTFFSGLVMTGIYSNYQLIINLATGLINSIFSNIASSIGNIIVTEDYNKRYQIYNVIFLVNFWISSIFASTINNASSAFISFWIGEEFIVNKITLYLLVANFFFSSIRPSTEQFKTSAGIYYEDRFIPILESVINVVACFLLGYRFGMTGVVAGNLISTLTIVFWQKPYITFKLVFNRSVIDYFKTFGFYFTLFIISIIISSELCDNLNVSQELLGFFIRSSISVLVTSFIFVVTLWHTKQFKDLMVYARKIFKISL